MSQQYPSQEQPYSPQQPPWQGQSGQPLPPPSPGPWQQPPNGYQQSGPQWHQQFPNGQEQYPQQYPQPGQFPPPMQPMQPPTPPKKKSRKGLWIGLGVLVVALVLCGVVASAVANSAKNATTVVGTTVATTTTSQAQSTTAPSSQHFKVGQVVKIGDTWQVTVNGVKSSTGDTFTTPSAGNRYVIVDVTLKNLSGQEQNISSALNFSLQDATGQKYTETILSNATPPDGKIEAGSLLRGQLSYEVPTSQKALTFNFEPDIVNGGQTVWDLNV